MTVHQQTGSSHGVHTTRCGLEGKPGKNGFLTSGWQSNVTCPQCLEGRHNPNPIPEKK